MIDKVFFEKCRSLGGKPYFKKSRVLPVLSCKLGSFEKAEEMIMFTRKLDTQGKRFGFSIKTSEKRGDLEYSLERDPRGRDAEYLHILILTDEPPGMIEEKFRESFDSIAKNLSNNFRNILKNKLAYITNGVCDIDMAFYTNEPFEDKELEFIFQNAKNAQREAQGILEDLTNKALEELMRSGTQVSSRTVLKF